MWVILNCGTILNETLILANGGPVEGTLAAVTDKPLSPRGFFPVHLTSEMVGSSPSSSDRSVLGTKLQGMDKASFHMNPRLP